ncbi:hypothetical protein ALC57_01466 [Trachymyrmex cornetzi]|uniref:Double jelly roll-like domain-containing protein n=1 Tax=Trachymyrmex cornetzi TaxID=471704 RepID=A0A151JPU2_9HYME|nr:hypothetical protein ALC57_01466 [Trachymyrmex cornetzi]
MSLTLTLSGKSTILAANYFPAIDLSDGDYELGLAIFETYNTIPNVNESNNKFYFAKDDAEITIPKGSYEVRDINEFLKRAILRKCPRRTVGPIRNQRNNDTDDDSGEYPITLRTNYNTMRCEIRSARHELILIRARNDNNCLAGDPATEAIIELLKIQRRMPHVSLLSEINKLAMLRALKSRRYIWAIKTATQLEKPHYVVFAFQTGRKNIMSEDISRFDDCKLTNAKLYLNSECYPYDDLNLDFEKNRCAILYDLYGRFCKGYYGYEYLEPSLTFTTFLRYGPFVIIDCSRQNESVKSGTVDVRLHFECKEDVPANTTAYCLIIHDRVVQYKLLTSVVRIIT